MNVAQSIRTHSKKIIMTLFVVGFATAGTALLVLSRAAVAVSNVQSGPWSSPSTWAGGHVPEAGDTITIIKDTTVTYDVTNGPVLGEMQIKGILTFDPAKSAKLTTERNIVVHGQLVMKPSSAAVEHFIQFANVREQDFVGGGMQVLASDVGLWVMDELDANQQVIASGKLDVAGTAKTSWTNATDALAAGATSVTLKDAPTGWRVGDTIIITPTETPTVGSASYDATEERTITAISGNTVNFNSGLTRAHPKVNNLWTAEVGNLTRNVRIEGTSTPVPLAELDPDDRGENRHTGNSHIFIHSSTSQNIAHAQLRYMGSAGTDERAEEPMNEAKLGRYSLHFHHNAGKSTGSVVDSVVVRDANFHQFVPHASDGIIMKNNIAYDNKSGAFWWDDHDTDRNSDSHHSVWDHNLVTKMRPRGDFIHSLGFFLPAGFNNKVLNNTYAGALGAGEDYAAFVWVNGNIGVWAFDGNVAHNNNSSAVRVWQNSSHVHPITNFAFYHNQDYGMNHGAYFNDYTYVNGHVYGNRRGGLLVHSSAGSAVRQRYQNIVWDGAGISPNLVQAAHAGAFHGFSTLFIDNTFQNYTQHAILVQGTGNEPKQLDIINPTFSGPSPAIFYGDDSSHSENIVRVQPKPGEGTPYQITAGNTRTNNIPAFAPAGSYGTGTGLLTEYFSGRTINANNKIFARLEPTVSNEFGEDDHIPPPWLQPFGILPFMMRWSGEFVPQEDASYVFTAEQFFRARMWINDQEVLNADSFHRDRIEGSPINLRAGQRYRIRVEGNFGAFTDAEPPGSNVTYIFSLFMRKADQSARENMVIPRSQLYCGTDPACSINTSSIPIPAPTPTPAPTPAPPPPPADTTAPTVSVTAPANNATITGVVDATANASDNVGVTQVEFLVDGQSRHIDITAPYSFSLSPTVLNLSNGNHSLTARARDAAGNVTTSSAVTITVNIPAPTPTPTPTPPPGFKAADINEDGKVNLIDVGFLKQRYGQNTNLGRADINGDGKVNLIDIGFLKADFGS